MELIAVVGPGGPERDGLLAALGRAPWAAGPAMTVDVAEEGLDAAERHRAWAALRRTAESGTTVVAGCGSAESAGPYAHRMVLMGQG